MRICSGEVWALDVDFEEQRLATGSADADLRLYSIASPEAAGAATMHLGAGPTLLVSTHDLHSAAILSNLST